MIKPICPHCKISLQRRSNAGVFQYFCTSCLGFSVAFGGLKKILDPSLVSRLWRDLDSAPKSEIACSHCRQPMREAFHSHGVKNIELDICQYCNLVWLDTGEWKDLENSGKSHSLSWSESEMRKQYLDALIDLEKRKTEKPFGSHVEIGDLSKVQAAIAFLGLPAEADSDRLQAEPWVTWFLVWSCLLLGFITFKQPVILKNWGYLSGLDFPQNFIRGVSSFFLHGGWMHLFSNMYFLWVFGDNVEDHLGKLKYTLLVILAAFMGHVVYGVLDPRAMTVPAVGASGGISGVITYYMIRYPSRRFVMSWRLLFIPRFFAMPAYVLGFLFLFKELLGAYIQHKGYGSVSSLSHLGGALVGMMFALIYAPRMEKEK